MKRVGLFTSLYNYGSLLQAYSTLKYFENHKFSIDLIMCYGNKATLLTYLKNKLAKETINIEPYILDKTFNAYKNRFISDFLKPIYVDYDSLLRIDKSGYYSLFLASSDQMWNASCKKYFLSNQTKAAFLQFAKKTKTASFGTSLGKQEINKNNIKTFKKYLKKVNSVSVRDNFSKDIINDILPTKIVNVLCDPVALTSPEEWRNLYLKNSSIKIKNYVLVHFLSVPSSLAIDCINDYISKDKDMKLVLFYNDSQYFDSYKNKIVIKGSPFDYLNLIDNSNYVFTDSFHTSHLSIIFNKPFFVFNRTDYAYNQYPQIIDLTNKYSCKNNYILENNYDFSSATVYVKSANSNLKLAKQDVENYLKNIVDIETNDYIVNDGNCVNCGICELTCKNNAIIKINDIGNVYDILKINLAKCTSCGMCKNICNKQIVSTNCYSKKGYVVYSKNDFLRKKAACGGTFSDLASFVLSNNGVVFGAHLIINGLNTICSCVEINDINDISLITNSKYVECDAKQAFPIIKKRLEENKIVLVGLTSCKIVALYKYLGKNYSNLYTVDLVCHGIVDVNIFRKYITYLEAKYKKKIISYKFREKTNNYNNLFDCYTQTITFEDNDVIKIPANKSWYMMSYFSCEIYRECCYKCKFASLQKPSDITLGDYFELSEDYPDIVSKDKDIIMKGVNACLINTEKGNNIFNKLKLTKYQVSHEKIKKSHFNLCRPPVYSYKRPLILNLIMNNKFNDIMPCLKSKLHFETYCYKIVRKVKRIIKKE